MNVGELLKERDRLLDVIEEAKSARFKLKGINSLIAMYGDDEKVSLNGHTPKPTSAKEELYCGKCDAGPFKGNQGVGAHNIRVHGGKVKVAV